MAVVANRRAQPRLEDPADLVQQSAFSFDLAGGFPSGLAEAEIGLVEPPAGWDLGVVWIARPCEQAPIVTVALRPQR